MAVTGIRSEQIADGQVTRADLNTTVSSKAVVAKLVQGAGIALSATGVDLGTGDVTVATSAATQNMVTNGVVKNPASDQVISAAADIRPLVVSGIAGNAKIFVAQTDAVDLFILDNDGSLSKLTASNTTAVQLINAINAATTMTAKIKTRRVRMSSLIAGSARFYGGLP